MKLDDRIKIQEKVDKIKVKSNKTHEEDMFVIRKDGIILEVKANEEE